MPGKLGIVFFALLALWLLWRSAILPLLSTNAKQKISWFIYIIITSVLLGIFVILVIIVLHLFGLGIIELLKSSGLEKLVEQ